MKDTIEPTPEEVLYAFARDWENTEIGTHTPIEDVLNWVASQDQAKFDVDQIAAFRQVALAELRRQRLVDTQIPGEFNVEFSGYGDSGEMYHVDNPWVSLLFEWHLQNSVHFDWYNNEGGGGDMTWTLDDDKIIINGYYNFVETVTEMNEEEF